ncbi:MAG: hypothetical protein H6828_10905 [Planctomycetes bacterium]|nr:hypothetical protein [Planctomycetota bacterium]
MKHIALATLLALLSACVVYPSREATTAFATRHDATHAELVDALAKAGWSLDDAAYDFHQDARGLAGDRYALTRADSRGRAELFVFRAEDGAGSVLAEVSEEVSDGRMYDLFDALRAVYDARPDQRTPGVVYCVDHAPCHVASAPTQADCAAAEDKLRAQSGCYQFGWNPPR